MFLKTPFKYKLVLRAAHLEHYYSYVLFFGFPQGACRSSFIFSSEQIRLE